MPRQIAETSIEAMLARERALFSQRNTKSKALAEAAEAHWLRGVPMHWMVDWGTPFPLFIESAHGVDLVDADGNTYVDFCLGDTGAMFGHSPPAVVKALEKQGGDGFTTMLPSSDAGIVGELLADRFGLPFWQVTATASDANRSVIRWCRAITGRKKILVFNGCYHGAVDETFVGLADGRQRADPALIGEPRDLNELTRVVEFNDLTALEDALSHGDVACVLAEPVMTNIGMVLPDAGFHAALRDLTCRAGTLLVIDETHTMSSGPGGYTRAHGLDPDCIVLGKPIAGGIPAAVYGFSRDAAKRVRDYLAGRIPGHSGIGTTLAGSKIQLALMRAVLETYMTGDAFVPLIDLARDLEHGLTAVITKHGVPWHVVRVGARVEFMCCETPPRNGGEAAKVIHRRVDLAIHHYLLNRGVVITPFHNMMLICPATAKAHVGRLVDGLDRCIAELS
ncbi:aspartate aminotransferase family protein [soil metagenome]